LEGSLVRIGILTFHYADNPGAVLQTYGLQKILESLGHAPKVIDFRYPSPFKFKVFLKKQAIQILAVLRRDKRDGPDPVAANSYRAFRDHWLHRTEHVPAVEHLPRIAEQFDAIIVGSDQVWNADFWSKPRWAYFLTFCDGKKIRRISYAACFGQRNQPSWYLDKLHKLLTHLDHVSVRGAFNRDIVKAHDNRSVDMVVDPTLLCTFDEIKAASNTYQKYALVYSQSRRTAPDFHKLARVLKEEGGLSIVSLSPQSIYPFADHYAVDAGPSEFIRLVSDAEFVLTTSYHGTIFSIKYRRPFISCCRGERFVRISDLLEMCGITERFVSSADEAVARGLLNAHIDYRAVERNIARKVDDSMSFLKRALE
jgi:hypothetical protein